MTPSTPAVRATESSYRNARIGLAAGDAWGYQVEFTAYAAMSGPVAAPSGTWIVSDDTQMTLALEDALIGTDPQDIQGTTDAIVQEFRIWSTSPLNDRAPGNTCMGSIRNLAGGRQWWESGGAIESAGCGAVMRLLPAALTDERRWAGLVTLQAVITHRHPLAVLSSLALAWAMRVRGGLTAASDLVEAIAEGSWSGFDDPYLRAVVSPYTPDLQQWLASEVPTVRRHLDAARVRLATGASGDPCSGVGEGWDSGTAIALALMVSDAPLAPREALEWAATSNGDSDSIAAIAGMILGSRSDEADFWAACGVTPVFEDVYHERIMRGSLGARS